jgi:hypothetical protein
MKISQRLLLTILVFIALAYIIEFLILYPLSQEITVRRVVFTTVWGVIGGLGMHFTQRKYSKNPK